MVVLFFISALLILGRSPYWLFDEVMILPTESRCLLSPVGVWQVPLLDLQEAQLFHQVPYLLYAVLSAVLITLFARLLTKACSLPAIGLVIAMSLVIQPLDLIPASLLLSLGFLFLQPRFQYRTATWFLAVAAATVAGIFVSLEYGLIMLLLTGLVISDRTFSVKTKLLVSVGILLGCLFIIAIWGAGFVHTLLRPISWVLVKSWQNLMPHLEPALFDFKTWPIFLLILLVLAFQIKNRIEKRILRNCSVAIFAVGCAAIAIGCRHYTFLASLICLLLLAKDIDLPDRCQMRWVEQISLVLCTVVLILQTDKVALLAGEAPHQQLSPVDWNTGGNVALGDLSQSSEWQRGNRLKTFQLILDDRWDVFLSSYRTYQLFMRDIEQVRILGYLREDGEMAGYLRQLNDWEVSLVVINTEDVNTIRRLVNSPHLKFMGCDAVNTIFGNQQVQSNLRQLQTSLNVLYQLEWPKADQQFSLENIIVANTDEHARRIANVVCSMRLPYAAMRFIRDDQTDAAQVIRTKCFLELAHRADRHTQNGSLLDQYRALVWLYRQWNEGLWSDEEVTRFASGLGLTFPGFQFISKPNRTPNTREERTRQALLQGNQLMVHACVQGDLLKNRELYKVLAESPDLSPLEIQKRLQELESLGASKAPESVAEINFFLGCSALETGDPVLAQVSFKKSLAANGSGEYSALCQLHLAQLNSKF